MVSKDTGYKGVEIHGDKIRISFMYEGVRCREVLPELTRLTQASYRLAARRRDEILARIEFGTFRYGDYFPQSPRAGIKQVGRRETFQSWSEQWLKQLPGIETSTLRAYSSAVAFWNNHIATKPLTDILPMHINGALVSDDGPKSAKTKNNYLSVLRIVLESARKNRLITENQANDIDMLPYQAPEPKPLSKGEMDKVLAHMAANYDEQAWAYFAFAFATGIRPSELIALSWGDIDFVNRTATVERALVAAKTKATKTNQVRSVRLNDVALEALVRQKKHTFMGGGRIFHNPATGRPWSNEKHQRTKYWAPALKAVGLAARDAYQTRHTYATILLSSGVHPSFIQKQLGHSTLVTTLKRYARFLPEALEAEMEKANLVFAPKMPQTRTGT